MAGRKRIHEGRGSALNMLYFLITVGAGAVIWYVVATLLICEYLRKKNQRVNYIFLKMMAPVYAHRYRKITRQETGKTGRLFYHWIISVNTMLVAAVLSLIIKYV
jgi:hypothetical protein